MLEVASSMCPWAPAVWVYITYTSASNHTYYRVMKHTQTNHVGSLQLTFLDGYCSTVQGLLDWFEVDLGFTELSFIQIDLCVLCDFVLDSCVSLSSCPFLDILHCLPRAVGVPLESALNLVSRMRPCGAHETHTNESC